MNRNGAISIADARAMALRAQGFGARTGSTVTAARVLALLRRIAPLQIDSVNVLVRAHYLPVFSRLGDYDTAIVDRLAYRERRLFEYWGHMASYLPVEHYPLMRWKMRAAAGPDLWKPVAEIAAKHPRYVEDVYDEVRARGPIAASELADPGKKAGPWWGWASGKYAMEWLFYQGRIAVAARRNFERIYDIIERVIPAHALEAPEPTEHDARRTLLVHSARALGVGTARDLFDYFRLKATTTRPVLRELVDAGDLETVAVDGWNEPAYVPRGARVPASPRATALLSPFDATVWERARAHRLFDFFYRIEIYTPPPKRVHGYYVLPFLHEDRLVARVDLKADRAARTLLVPGAFAEPGNAPGDVAEPLARALRAMAVWLGLDDVRAGSKGNVARALKQALRRA